MESMSKKGRIQNGIDPMGAHVNESKGESNLSACLSLLSSSFSIPLFSQSSARHSWEGAFACLWSN